MPGVWKKKLAEKSSYKRRVSRPRLLATELLLGSDAHTPEYMAAHFEDAKDILENEIGISLCGFEVVRDGIPEDDF
jgi:hypothetical protein